MESKQLPANRKSLPSLNTVSSDSRNPFTGVSSRDYELNVGETAVIGIFVQMIQAIGMPRSLGEIYGLLFATPYPLSFQDIQDRLDLSKGSVSQGLRFLRSIGAIQPVVVPEDRREYFEPVVELRALVGGILQEKINPQLAEWGVRAKALKIKDFRLPASSQLTANSSKLIETRIDKLKTWQKRANTVLPMVGKLLG